MKIISPYQKSLWVRNLLLVLVAIALIGVSVKIVQSYQKSLLMAQAKDHYESQNLLLAEETYAKASEISAIHYEEEPWSALLSRLTAVRLELESLARDVQFAIQQNDPGQAQAAYQSYQSLKQQAAKDDNQVASFFNQIAQRLAIENQLGQYYQQAMKDAKGQLQANLDQKQYKNHSFIHTLATIPDEYYGGKDKKEAELEALFLRYERTKLRDLSADGTFFEVITSFANSRSEYAKANFPTDWLITLLERYAKEEINQTIRQQDLGEFVTRAKAYLELKSFLPSQSEVVEMIEKHLKEQFRKAEQYVKTNHFEKAIELFQELSRLEDITEQLSELEQRWTSYDPGRLLQAQFPDKALQTLMTGKELWGAQAYAIGWDEADGHLYMAASMEDGSTIKLDQALSLDRQSVIFSLSEMLGSKENPVLVAESAGKERAYSYLGLVPDLSRATFVKRWQLEADGWEAQSTDQILVKNPVGEGEREIAHFVLKDSGLEYKEKWADYLVDSDETQEETSEQEEGPTEQTETDQIPDTPAASEKPADIPADIPANIPSGRTFDVYAGPGEEHAMIGQVIEGSYQVISSQSGWQLIHYGGSEGWIRALPPNSQ
ncbi:SH3 domain-containing protein [Brevibacillus invocatus]|uniref:SH3 domain-containing protein n=1 Tax=Brevibacillus invocatus TaxID=173959 RepID=UPI00203E97E4|nr:SH3 domain-containing protein [Brevibacillus invocatus]MCM3077701.1 SH3 domain-containing protein [Brevibacillus invocatus]MCM3428703.1 SH3 domain-containing protein [Brevibacillus invocatus]